MSSFEQALRAIREAPRGPQVAAFFDLDGTLVSGFTAIVFVRDMAMRGELPLGTVLALARKARANGHDPEAGREAIEGAARLMAGKDVATLEAHARRLFRRSVAPTVRPAARALVRAHGDAGHTLVLASAATRFQAEPVARDLGIPHLITTRMVERDGKLTGEIEGIPRWGDEKARAVLEFAAMHDIDRSASFAYGNGAEDQAFLATVGHPVAVRPDRGLEVAARVRGIPVLDLPDRPRGSLRRTIAALGAFNVGLTGTLVASAVIGKRQAARHGFGRTTDLALAAAGVKIRVTGQAHLDAARPAVVVYNHQSNLDPLIVASLLQQDFTAVGKQEVASDPRGWLLSALDFALIDRSDPAKAKAGLQALVHRIQGGESVMIAPEGTRMPSPRLGTFKRGAFHLAIDARVPVVPIVVRNSGELWPPGALLISPGHVDVQVLPPVSTDGWTRATVGVHADDVRRRFEEALHQPFESARDE